MAEHGVIRSVPFAAPFVRVRGRLSRQGVVAWSPCLRTFRGPGEAAAATVVAPDDSGYAVAFEDAQGRVLARAAVRIRFAAPERQWALFTQRMPYEADTRRVVLLLDGRELGALVVPSESPEFFLVQPVSAEREDTTGILRLGWRARPGAAHETPQITYYVRYSADGERWHRPGVNLTTDSFDLDLREMPGGARCVAQVIGTNGYQTSYVETPPFPVPRKGPEILLDTASGPVLFAQGISREDGPLVGESIVWLADGENPVGTGATFDARRVGIGRHRLAVRVTDSAGAVRLQQLGWYEGETGRRVGPLRGA